MNPGKLLVNVGIFKIIRLYRPNSKKMKNFFYSKLLLQPVLISHGKHIGMDGTLGRIKERFLLIKI